MNHSFVDAQLVVSPENCSVRYDRILNLAICGGLHLQECSTPVSLDSHELSPVYVKILVSDLSLGEPQRVAWSVYGLLFDAIIDQVIHQLVTERVFARLSP